MGAIMNVTTHPPSSSLRKLPHTHQTITLWCLWLSLLGCSTQAYAFTLQVTGPNGTPLNSGYRYLVEEDLTLADAPETPALPGKALSMSFHRSYMPVVTSGESSGGTLQLPLDASKRYYVSVLPSEGYALGGAAVAVGQSSVAVVVQPLPLPTAQISLFVFNDNHPINNAPDLPEEEGLGAFDVLIFEAGGRYGASGGRVSQDAFGNPLGTTYRACTSAELSADACELPGNKTVDQLGSGYLKTDANGELVIQNLYPGKYTLQVVPPSGQGWVQTATIEGTKGIDAWVKANEPVFFQEFGPPGYHVFVGFTKPLNDVQALNGIATLSGQVVNMHASRPPDFTFYHGEPVGSTWIGLNELPAAGGRALFAAAADPESGRFAIPRVPAGTYQLVVWDEPLDMIFAFHTVTIPAGATEVELLDVPVFSWFARLDTTVFYDDNENGLRDPGEDGIPNMTVNIRWRDGTLYQTMATDNEGMSPFQEVFPFFNWLVAEVDYSRFKATGATFVVDGGGAVMPDEGWDYPSRGKLTPQEQCDAVDPLTFECLGPRMNPLTGNHYARTEQGPVLTQAFQAFLGQTNVMEFGKAVYGPGENGGISGIVYYATTRAENNPRDAVAESWEPGIPRVQVNLYEDLDRDGGIDDLNGDGDITLADVDNFPFDWRPDPLDPSRPSVRGEEDIDQNHNGIFEGGDAIAVTTSDSWDDNQPSQCQGDIFYSHGQPTDCFDGLRNYNQIRPGVFDGGYAFASYVPGGLDSGNPELEGLPAEMYIVEANPPPGYELLKEEDKNVDFGDSYTPAQALMPPPCVGDPHLLPPTLSLFPSEPNPSYDPSNPNKTVPLCNRKQVLLSDGTNAAADFFLFTYVPVAAHMVGFILNDLANEFDPNAPTFGEKFAPSWVPVSIQDWTGQEIGRTYSDEYGTYNALVPSTYSVNVPAPSGVAPNMLTACMNHPGPIVDQRVGSPTYGQEIEDPYFNRQYSQFCYTFQYMPGTTTYLDTPVLPVAAFAGTRQFPLDCEYQSGVPMIYSVSGPAGGPWVSTANNTQRVTILSAGSVDVPNPAFDGVNGVEPRLISRDYSFGSTAGRVLVNGLPLVVESWNPGMVVARVPFGITTGTLTVERSDQTVSPVGVTLTIGGSTPRTVAPGGSIQAVIDAAPNNSLILVPPGVYRELVVIDRPVRLQGWGALSTLINAAKTPTEKLAAWRTRVTEAVNSGRVSLLPGQTVGAPTGLEPPLLGTEEGPGIVVLARNASPAQGGFGTSPRPRIDGFTITGGDTGGGIFVNGYANHLQISNNRVASNQGTYHGGIRVGHPFLTTEVNGVETYVDGNNDDVLILNNQVIFNGGLDGYGGGISLATGSNQYRIRNNFVCGNFTAGQGAGIGHYGLSTGGVLERNQVLFNQSFNQGQTVNGGGLIIAGAVAPGTALSQGAGTVTVQFNTFQGNLSGAGDGGAIRLDRVNGSDVSAAPNNPNQWYRVNLLNNVMVNNVAGLAGGALSIQDALRVSVVQNTIVHNDSTATAGEAFSPGNPNSSVPQPAGIVARAHSLALYNAIGRLLPARPYRIEYPNVVLTNNILWENRSFYFTADVIQDPALYTLHPVVEAGEAPVFWDLGVLGTSTPALLNPQYCLLTQVAGYASTNLSGDPRLSASYFNGDSTLIQQVELTTGIQAMPAFDEGGNFIDVRFGPLSVADPTTGAVFADPLLLAGSLAIDRGNNQVLVLYPSLTQDLEGDSRPLDGNLDGTAIVDIGADEY